MKFSCIIGTYNPKTEWLQRAISSVGGLFDEVILVDDGSTHISWSDLKTGYLTDIIQHESNKGFYEARNTGIRAATGDIICSLDDDDYFDRDGVVALKKFVEDNPDFDIYHFILQQFNESKDLYGVNADPNNLPSFNPIPSQSWFKKKLWEDVGGFTYPLAEDYDFWVRAWAGDKKFAYFNKVVYNYQRRSGSLSMNFKKPFDEMRIEIMERNNLI
jgi:glycosyltransferase involved in cell wall biosynthesis